MIKNTELPPSTVLQHALDKLLTVHDICDMFGVTAMTVYTWRQTRDFPTIDIKGGPRHNVRGSVRFHPDDVAAWARTQGLLGKPLPTARKRVRLAA